MHDLEGNPHLNICINRGRCTHIKTGWIFFSFYFNALEMFSICDWTLIFDDYISHVHCLQLKSTDLCLSTTQRSA